MKSIKHIFLVILVGLMTGCAVTVTYQSEPPGAIIIGRAHEGGVFNYATPMKLSYPGAQDTFNKGTCPIVESPTARWPDGTTVDPVSLQLCHRDSDWTFYKPAPTFQQNVQPNQQNLQSSRTDSPQASLEDAKRKCTELGFKAGTEQFGKCALQLSK